MKKKHDNMPPMRAPKVHELKTHPVFFQEAKAGNKNFEVRLNDRDFQAGDYLRLREYNPNLQAYTLERPISFLVTYALFGPQLGIKESWCVMALTPAELNDLDAHLTTIEHCASALIETPASEQMIGHMQCTLAAALREIKTCLELLQAGKRDE